MSVIGELLKDADRLAKEDGFENFDCLNEFFAKEYYALAKYERSMREQQEQAARLQEQQEDNVVGIGTGSGD